VQLLGSPREVALASDCEEVLQPANVRHASILTRRGCGLVRGSGRFG
jgi:hypothetical protein